MRRTFLALVALGSFVTRPTLAGVNKCDPGEGPDIIVGDIPEAIRFGDSVGVGGYAIGTEACNLGTCWASWISGTPFHPVIAQNMYRLHQGRFEQIGMSWLKHGFATFNDSLCGTCVPADGQHLGVNCSDTYSAGLNAAQGSLGPRGEANPETGVHLHPYSTQGQTGNEVYKRLQVANADLNTTAWAGALYFVEAQYVAQDDAAAFNNLNNNSYRRVQAMSIPGGQFSFQMMPQWQTVREQPAIAAWRETDPAVDLSWAANGFVVAGRATDLGNGTWHYEYAVQNLVSDRGARSFTVSLPHGVELGNAGFHDIAYHSGDPYSSDDWAVTLVTGPGPNSITWQTATFEEDPNANALRWGTLYNFRFDANVPPRRAVTTLGLFKPGQPAQYSLTIVGPDRCGDQFCEGGENKLSCAADCAAADLGAGEIAPTLVLSRDPKGHVVLEWGTSCLTSDDDYEVYRGELGNYASHVPLECTTGGSTTSSDDQLAGDHYYLVVPHNGSREGGYGAASDGTPRSTGPEPCREQLIETCD